MFLILIAGMKKNETTTMKIHCETEQTRQILRRKGVLVIILSASSSVTRTRQFGGVSRIRYVSDTDTYRIRHGYVSWTYPRAGPYWAGKPHIGYVSGLPNTAQLPTHLKEHIAPVALPQLPHAQPLVPLPHARLAPPLVAAARRSSLRPRRRRQATAAARRDPRTRSSPRGGDEPEPRLHRCRDQRTSARLAAAEDLRPSQGAKELLLCSCSLPSPVLVPYQSS